jgi:hypothetical protein
MKPQNRFSEQKFDMKTKLLAILALACLSTLNLQLAAAPMGTAFTYQGVATDNGRPATGLYDVQCALYNSPTPTSGAQVGPTLNFPGSTTDSNGVFTVLLDFGPGVFTGQALWLEFSLRTNGSSGAYTTLAPRQQLTPAPAAIWSTTAQNLAGILPSAQLTGTYSSSVTFTHGANIFVGDGAGLRNVMVDQLSGHYASEFVLLGTYPYFALLDVTGDISAGRLKVGNSHSLSGIYATIPGGYQNQASGDYSLAAGYRAKAKHAGTFVWADNTAVDFASTATNQFLIRASGGVGIGTRSPQCPLDVAGYGALSCSYGYLNASGATGTSSGNNWYSIRAAARILATEFNAYSDLRGKQIVGRSDPRADLETIRQLRVTNFRHIDTIAKGAELKKGFIAQEVARVVPDAVTASPNFIPNIYARAAGVAFDPQHRTLALTTDNLHGLSVGDQVRLVTGSGIVDRTVTRVASERQFVVSGWDNAVDQVFVYGKYVTDYLTLDYDRLFTTGIGAVQELASQLEAKDARIGQLESDVAELKRMVNALSGQQKQDGQ